MGASPTAISYGAIQCDCCCGTETIHTNHNCDPGQMRCVACTCRKTLPANIKASVVQIRLYHIGQQTHASMRELSDLAELLGANENSKYKTDRNGETFIEIDTTDISSRLQIKNFRDAVNAGTL